MANTLPKSTYQSFVQDWNGRKSWAQQNGIPFNDFAQTVKFDYNRMLTGGYGNKMSDTEAFDSMAALKSGQNPFSTPADTAPTILSNPLEAIDTNLQNIFTGLFHAPGAIAHDVNEAIHGHPGDIANLVPGYTDITSLFSSQGRQYLLQNPVSDIVDFAGVGKLADLAETGLRNAGMNDMANTLSLIPDHPVSKAVKKAAGVVTDNFDAANSIKQFGVSILGDKGQLGYQKEMILRPISAANSELMNVPAPDFFTRLKDITFGQKFKGRSVIRTIEDLRNKLSDGDVETVQNMFNYSHPQGYEVAKTEGPWSISKMKNDPSLTPAVRGAYKTLVQMQSQLQWAEILYENKLAAVENPVTHDIGYVRPDSPFIRYIQRWKKLYDKNVSDTGRLASAVTNIYQNLYKIRDASGEIPDQLKVAPNEQVTIPTALRRIADYYQTNRQAAFKHPSQGNPDFIGKTAYAGFTKSIDRVFGEDSAMQRIINHIPGLKSVTDGDEILKAIRSVRSSVKRMNLDATSPVYTYFLNTLDDVERSVKIVQNNQLSVAGLQSAADASKKAYDRLSKSMELNWNKYVEQKFAPLVDKKLTELMVKNIKDLTAGGQVVALNVKNGLARVITPEEASNAIDAIQHKNYNDPSVRLIITDSEFYKMRDEAYNSITDMKAQGFEPMFTQGIRERSIHGIESPSIGDVSRTVKRSVGHDRQAVLSDTMYDPFLGIVKEATDIVREHFVNHIHTEFLSTLLESDEDLLSKAKTDWAKKHPDGVDLMNDMRLVQRYVHDNGYVTWEPDKIDALKNTTRSFTTGPKQWIKGYDHRLIAKTFDSYMNEFNLAWDKTMGIYRIGVLYASPRYAAHIIVGGSTMTELRMVNPIRSTYRYLGQAIDMAKGGNLPVFMSKGVSEQDARGALFTDPFGTHNFLVGHKLGQLVAESRMAQTGSKVLGGLAAYKHFLETVSNVQRSLALLDKKATLRPEEITPEVEAMAKRWNTTPEEWVGAQAANKVLADMQTVSPFERGVIQRFLIPFWGWNRHIIRYVLTFPSDHPLRASILQSATQQAIGDDRNIPEYLFRLLFLGEPNSQGNVSVLDTRQWNPFRDVANYMTVGGWTASLNPVLSGLVQSAFNVDPVTGGPDLYPSLTFDSFYGSQSSTPGTPAPEAIAQQFSPQLDTLMGVMSSTSALRQEAKTNPGKLPYLIADSLGLPWVPYDINVKKIAIQKTMDEYKAADTAVQQALGENSMAPLKGFSGLLPLNGYEVNKDYINELIQSALAQTKVNGINIPEADLLQLPYASPYFPEYLLAGQNNS